MTLEVMRAFGVSNQHLTVAPQSYRPATYAVEPDASAASYWLAAAAITGGSITVEGLGTASIQGDVRFADLLEQMGAEVVRGEDRLTVRGTGTLHGIDVDMADISDTAQTLAAIAPFAETPTTITGIGFIRAKETDRIGATVTELRRLGIDADELPDGMVIRPGSPKPGAVHTYDDHRMAMSFALIGLRTGVDILDPDCVTKTFPGFWDVLDSLRGAAR
jgi:3-phosphoshikimate 1-carboxyvinyltransferase